MSEFTGDRYTNYDFGKMNRKRYSQNEPSQPIEQPKKRQPDPRLTLDAATLQGRERIWESMAQGIAGSVLDIRKQSTREALSPMFTEHRMEAVAISKGVTWVNDSKATNVNSTWFAMESISTPIIWIMGGVDSGNDYTKLAYLVQRKVKSIIILGGGAIPIHRNFASLVDMVTRTFSMEEAVKMAAHYASKGDTVLLSPSCPSFDLFEDYQDRGRQFKNAVRAIQ